jgi:hypothetical protein
VECSCNPHPDNFHPAGRAALQTFFYEKAATDLQPESVPEVEALPRALGHEIEQLIDEAVGLGVIDAEAVAGMRAGSVHAGDETFALPPGVEFPLPPTPWKLGVVVKRWLQEGAGTHDKGAAVRADDFCAPYQVQLDNGRMIFVPSDQDSCIRVAGPDAPASPHRELANPEWLARAETMPNYKSLVELAVAVGDYPEPTVAAALTGILESVRQLLAAGADPSQAHGSGMTPLFVAARRGDYPLVRLLLAHGASVHGVARDVARGVASGTALHAICMYDVAQSDNCAEVLVRAGCDTRARMYVSNAAPGHPGLTSPGR